MKTTAQKKLVVTQLRDRLIDKENTLLFENSTPTYYGEHIKSTQNNQSDLIHDSHWGKLTLSDFYIKGYMTGSRSKTHFYDVGMHEGIRLSNSDLQLEWKRDKLFSATHQPEMQLVFKMKSFQPGFLDATDYFGHHSYRHKLLDLITLYDHFQTNKPVLGKCVHHTENGSIIMLAGGLFSFLPENTSNKVSHKGLSESQVTTETKMLVSKRIPLNAIFPYIIEVFDNANNYYEVSRVIGKVKPLSIRTVCKKTQAVMKNKKYVQYLRRYLNLITKPVNVTNGTFMQNFMLREKIKRKLTGQKLLDYLKKRNKTL